MGDTDIVLQGGLWSETIHTARQYAELPFVLMTAYGTIEKAVAAMRDGASDFLVKPFEAEVLLEMVEKFVSSRPENEEMIVADPASRQLASLAQRVAASDTTVMLTGESGTGKEVVARFIHRNSRRARGPFVAINCAAIPENMLEAILFGHEKGTFTGAYQSRAGKFEQAQGGILLLDEVTEMDLGLQSKLLRVLQEKEVERLGGSRAIPLDVRVIATSNRDLLAAVQAGDFRQDLYYRLNVFPIRVPPLRERPGDILPLARRFLVRHLDQGAVPDLSSEAMALLQQHSWPGNVRELENVMQRALILRVGDCITAREIHFEEVPCGSAQPLPEAPGEATAGSAECLEEDLRRREADLIMSALREGGTRVEVARKLGISPRTLRYKLAKLREAGIALPA
jgi:two-component system response regulator FlrC